MTCIVGIRTDEGALIAFDSQSSAGGELTLRRDLKGGVLDDRVAFGYTYSYRYGQIIRYHVTVPPFHGDEHEWTIKSLVPAMRKALSEHGWIRTDSDREQSGQCIVGVRNRIFVIESDNAVTEPYLEYCAVGSGREYAMGALTAIYESDPGLYPEAKAELALAAAAQHNAFVAAPWHIVKSHVKRMAVVAA